MSQDRQLRLWLAAITAVGAIIRLGMTIGTKIGQPLLLNDSIYYSVQARQLASGNGFRDVYDLAAAEHGPLTAVVLAPVSWLDDAVFWQRMTNTVLGVVTVPLIGLLGYRAGGRRAAVVAAALAAVYPNLWMNDSLVMSESVTVFVLVVCLLAAVRWIDSPSLQGAALVGGLVGLCALARSELLLLAPLFALIDLAIRRRSAMKAALVGAVVTGATCAAVLAPWFLYNLSRFERPVILTTNDGTTLLGSSCDDSFHGDGTGSWSVLCVLPPNSPEISGEDPSERSARQRSEAIDYIGDNAGRLPVVMVARVARALDLYAIPDMLKQDVGEERPRSAAWAGVVMWWLLAPMAVMGLLRIRRRHRALLIAPVVTVAITTVVFYGAHRIRTPLEPSVLIGAAVFITGLQPFGRWFERRSFEP